jgi:glycosyltransferase involved in cell wall biosynthesis
MVENYLRWFYNSADEIKVPTAEYISILEKRGYLKDKMGIFRRGFDSQIFKPRPQKSHYFRTCYSLKKGVNLIYSGRISKDKNMDLLIEAYLKACKKIKDINLILVGDGPYYDDLRKKYSGEERILLTGRVPHEIMPEIYSDADIFVFPSSTDTFGMAVLEAQACGVPAIVSDIGGPREIIQDGLTGFMAIHDDRKDWTQKIENMYDMIKNNPRRYGEMCLASWVRMMENHSWDNLLSDMYDEKKATRSRNITAKKLYKPVETFAYKNI